MGLSTQEITDRCLDLVGWDSLPGDSAVHVPADHVESALVAIDARTPELHLAKDAGYDLVLAHHPVGTALVGFPSVLDRQVELMTDHGVPEAAAEDAVVDLRRHWKAETHKGNYRHEPSVAELLEQPYMNLHLPPDEIGRRAFVDAVAEADPKTVGDLANAFAETFLEIRAAETDVQIRVGRETNPVGDLAIHHAAGANGGASVAEAYFENGVDTVVYIHADGETERQLRERYGEEKNLVVTGHIASDAIGMNRVIDELEAAGVECTPISGCGHGRT